MKVLMIIDSLPHKGGMELQSVTLGRALRALGVEVRYLSRSGDFSHLPVSEQTFIDTIPNLPDWIPGPVAAILYLIQVLIYLVVNRRKIDILHAHALANGIVAALVSRVLHKPALVKVASAGPKGEIAKHQRSWLSSVRRKLLNMIDFVVSVTPEVSMEIIDAGFKPEKIIQIPNGVDTSLFILRPTIHKSDEKNQITPVVICVGRLVPKKRHSHLISAWRMVIAEILSAQLILVGDGPLRRQLERQIALNKLEKSVQLLGEVEPIAIRHYLNEANLFVMPSTSEGLSNAMLEALACGVPVVTTKTKGTSFFIRHGETGLLLTEPVNDETLAKAIIKLLKDRQKLISMGQNARNDVESRFAIDQIARSYLKLYERL